MKLKVLELFSGTGHISNTFRARGHRAWKVDWSKDLDANLHTDISKLTADNIKTLCNGKPNVIWASPDCTTYSIAATIKGGGFKHRELGTYEPKTEYAKFCDICDQHVIDLIAELKPKYWFIENPRGMMRHMPWMISLNDKLKGAKRYTITYCSYGGQTMKPTDIWTNHPNPNFLPICKGQDCEHLSWRREGGQTEVWNKIAGKGMYSRAIVRGLMPQRLLDHIVDICEEG